MKNNIKIINIHRSIGILMVFNKRNSPLSLPMLTGGCLKHKPLVTFVMNYSRFSIYQILRIKLSLNFWWNYNFLNQLGISEHFWMKPSLITRPIFHLPYIKVSQGEWITQLRTIEHQLCVKMSCLFNIKN